MSKLKSVLSGKSETKNIVSKVTDELERLDSFFNNGKRPTVYFSYDSYERLRKAYEGK